MSSGQQSNKAFTRQATILRKNLQEWDRLLRAAHGEDWPTMLGRLNAAHNQTANWDRSIEEVYEHFSHVPKQATANPQDIPFFLSTRLVDEETTEEVPDLSSVGNPVQHLTDYEKNAAKLVATFEDRMVRF